jgi:hypothetical protein
MSTANGISAIIRAGLRAKYKASVRIRPGQTDRARSRARLGDVAKAQTVHTIISKILNNLSVSIALC